MKDILATLAAAIILAAISAAGGYWVGHSAGAAAVAQRWDKATAQQATAAVDQSETNRRKEADHATASTQAVDRYQTAQATAAHDHAARAADALRLQRSAETRAAQYRAMSQASEAERERLASHAARLDASLADGRQVVADLRATVVDRDNRIQLLADTIRADRALTPAKADQP
ncbi:MAG: hypothetical protein GAK30_01584 [Paracidovorax wautersii]|uniref:Uncharacterized protein n=1 Tax=Paracidovorax wautersii TaxID=1177982 RepID=A0A7V8JQM2_9BURK|nr:MAG: hypothetical protein GAK30_01584 [Paracidovorax wautersii]